MYHAELSCTMRAGYVGIVGFVVWAALRWFQAGVDLVQAWCVYGYAMAVYIPMALLCIAPSEVLRWSLVGAATLASGLFLLLNFRGPMLAAAGAKGAPLLLGMAGLHALLGLVLKLYFFHYSA
jgi:hypothetical protein